MNSSMSDNEERSCARNEQSTQLGESSNADESGCSANNLNIESEGELGNNSMAQTSQSLSPQIDEREPSTSNLLFRMSDNIDISDQVSTMYLIQPPDQDSLDLPLAVDRDDSDGSIVLIYNNDQAPHHSDMDLHSNSNESLLLGGLGELNGLRRMNGLRQFNDLEMNSGSFVSLVRESGSSNYIDLLDQESGDGLHVCSSDNMLVPNPPNEGWNDYSWNNRHEIHSIDDTDQVDEQLNGENIYNEGENNNQATDEAPHVEPIDQEYREDEPGVSAEAGPLDIIFDRGPSTSNANQNDNQTCKSSFSCLSTYSKAIIGALRCHSGTNVSAFREAIWSYLMDFSIYEDDRAIEIPWLRAFKSELALSTLDIEDNISSGSDTSSDSPVEAQRTISEPSLNMDARRILQQKLTKRSSHNMDISNILNHIEQSLRIPDNPDHQNCPQCANMIHEFVCQCRKERHTDNDDIFVEEEEEEEEEKEEAESSVSKYNETNRNDTTNRLFNGCCIAEANFSVEDEMDGLSDTEDQDEHAACCCPSTCICQTPTRCLGDPFCPCRNSTQPPSGSSGTCNNLSMLEYKFDQQSKGHTSENQRIINNGKYQEQYQKQGESHTSMLYDALINLYNIRSSENFCECSESSVHTKKWLSYEDGDEELYDYIGEYGENECHEKKSSSDDDDDDDDDDDSEKLEELHELLLEQYTNLRIEMDSQQHNILKIAGQQVSIIYQLSAINSFILTVVHVLGKMVCKVMNRREVMTRYMPVGRFLSIFRVTNYAFGDFMFKFVNKPEELSQQDYASVTTFLGIIASITKTHEGRIIIIIFYNLCIAPAGLIALQHQSSILNEIQTYIVSDVNYEKKVIGLKFLDLLTRRVLNKKVFKKIEEFVPRHVLCTDSYDEEYNVIRQLSVKVLRNLLNARDRFRTMENKMISAFSEGHEDYYPLKQCILAHYFECATDYAAKSREVMN